MKHNPEVEKKWFEQLKAFEISGLPISHFCKKHHLKEHQFYYWRDKFKHKTFIRKTEPPLKFIPVKPIKQEPATVLRSAAGKNTMNVIFSIEGNVQQNTHIEIKAFIKHD